MARFIRERNRITVKLEVPIELKKKISGLLNQLMQEYGIKGKDDSFDKAFKDIFKSNLYVLLDNQYHNKEVTGNSSPQ
jgi:hypothetical protein